MKTIKLTKGFEAVVDDDLFEYLNGFKWHYDNQYAARKQWIPSEKRFEMIYMHRLVNKTPKHKETDHINRNKLDNRKENLRTVTRSGNSLNHGLRSDNTSGHKGVSFSKKDKSYRVRIVINNKEIGLGYYKDIAKAIEARKKGEELYIKW